MYVKKKHRIRNKLWFAVNQTSLRATFRPFPDKFVLVNEDDIIIYSKIKNDQVQNLKTALNILREIKLCAKLFKCEFMRNQIEYFGKMIHEIGLKVDSKKMEAVKNWEVPQNVTQVQSFVCLCCYYMPFAKTLPL